MIQWTWGLPQTLLGAAVFIVHKKDRHFDYNGATATEWKRSDGVSLGKFIFVPEGSRKGDAAQHSNEHSIKSDDFLLIHEYGHTIQSLVLGPLYLPVIGIPSFIWSNVPAFARKRQREQRSYYSFWVERSANWLGERVLHRPSIGQALVD